MKLNVAQLMKSPVGTTREYDLEETLREVEDQPLTRPVKVYLHLTRINDGVLARGDVETTLEIACSRCTEPAEQPVAFHFDERREQQLDASVLGAILPARMELRITGRDHALGIDAHRLDEMARHVDGARRRQLPVRGKLFGVNRPIVGVPADQDLLLLEILENAAKEKAKKGTDIQLIGDFYASCMDEAGIERAGTAPLAPLMAKIAAIKIPLPGHRELIHGQHRACAERRAKSVAYDYRVNSLIGCAQ